MCGIFGWIARSDNGGSLDELRRLTNILIERGPDDHGYELLSTNDGKHQIGLGHRRLAIIDLTPSGAQPMWSRERDMCITFNGEIYNYIELRAQLESLGHKFYSTSDTEVLLVAVRAWGVGALNRFRGMFAFALFDARDQSVLLARDPFGKKPLFYYEAHERIYFASEIEPIVASPGVESTLDWSALDNLLRDRYVAGPATLFKGVKKLGPGCFAIWREDELSVERYFTPPIATIEPYMMNFDEAVKIFRSSFDHAVRIRMRSDAPFGVFLSGGIDSSAVVASMAKWSNKAIRTFSVGFSERDYSEFKYCKIIAGAYRTDHHEMTVSADAFFDNWDEAVRKRGAPVTEPSDIPMLLLARAARSSVKMVMTGEGSDELLAGYPKHVAERYVAIYGRWMPKWLHERLIAPAVARLPYGMRRIKVLEKAFAERNHTDRMRLWFGGLSADERDELRDGAPIESKTDPFPFSMQSGSDLRRVQFFDQTSYLPDNTLERADRMLMAGSIEGRAPFMDVELAKLVAGMPDDFLIRGLTGKFVLRIAFRGELPPSILARQKNGFRVPIHIWFRDSHRDLVRDLLASASSKVRGAMNARVIDRMLGEHFEGRVNHERELWTLCNLEKFVRIYDLDMSLDPRRDSRAHG
jgi:asparagine synthase (glutamine-hydrolysing)